jgi:5'-phosphate synthase pdxT subunit
MDIRVERNAFGRQVDSFETGLQIKGLNGKGPFPAIFIRAPRIAGVNDEDVQVLARLEDGTAVAAQQGHWLVTSFHPELSDDDRLHRYFLDLIAAEKDAQAS